MATGTGVSDERRARPPVAGGARVPGWSRLGVAGCALAAVLACAFAPTGVVRADDMHEVADSSVPKLHFGGFTDFDFFASNEKGAAVRSGFSEGQVVFHLSSALSSKIFFFSELSLTAKTDGFSAEVERAFIRFEQSDLFKVSAGRFHTPINYWNVAFHHGQWLQTSISRPQMTMFGGRFIPVHFIGVQAEGTVPAGKVSLGWNAGVGNGRGGNPARGGDAGDINNTRAWLASLSLRPNSVYDLQFGAAYYNDRITLPTNDLDEWIASGYVALTRETPEIIAEYAAEDHRDRATGARYRDWAYYIQIAYRLPCGNERWKPYVRYENTHVDEGDPVFADSPSRKLALVGIRFDFKAPVAIKGEIRRDDTSGQESFNAIYMAVSYAF